MYQLHVMLNERERRKFEQQAQLSGLSRSSYIRALIMGKEIKEKPPKEYAELVRELSAIGNNINQMARIANTTYSIQPPEMARAVELTYRAWELLQDRL